MLGVVHLSSALLDGSSIYRSRRGSWLVTALRSGPGNARFCEDCTVTTAVSATPSSVWRGKTVKRVLWLV